MFVCKGERRIWITARESTGIGQVSRSTLKNNSKYALNDYITIDSLSRVCSRAREITNLTYDIYDL